MSSRREALKNLLLGSAAATLASPLRLSADTKTGSRHLITANGQDDRKYWAELLYKIADPVFSNLANDSLKKNMKVQKSPRYAKPSVSVTYLEAVGRSLAGIAPWLALPDDATAEGKLRKQLREKVLEGLANAVNPSSADYLNFSVKPDAQPIVDAAYLVQGFMRAPKALWEPLDNKTKRNTIDCLKKLQVKKFPNNNNWVLFSAAIEAFLLSAGEHSNNDIITAAVQKIEGWYVGDGWYSDGPHFALDYYNSYVIHPFMIDVLNISVRHGLAAKASYDKAFRRMVRYAEEEEMIISPEGTYPPVGRSIPYRTAAFQALALVSLMEKLPQYINPAQVRCALTKVMDNMFGKHPCFDDEGWLLLGFCGYQPGAADSYTSTGSLYMATLGFLPLGLPADNAFWTNPPAEWTSVLAWSGKPFHKDYHVDY